MKPAADDARRLAFFDQRSESPYVLSWRAKARWAMNGSLFAFRLALLLLLLLPYAPLAGAAEIEPDAPRQRISLNGEWQFQRDGAPANEWKTVNVPSSFQSHEGTDFHGVGWYRKSIAPFPLAAGKRALLHFQAAATEARVWWDGVELGSHLGGWTPFRFDITALLRTNLTRAHELKVRLDEKVGHNTQGFLPIIAPHFGGLWQDVGLLILPETYADDLELLAIGDPKNDELRLEFPVVGDSPDSITDLSLRCRLHGEERWTELSPTIRQSQNQLLIRAAVAGARQWSPADPNLYDLELILPGPEGDRLQFRAAFRSIETFGEQFRLNGQPLSIRGLLNWGYSPPRVDPNPGEAVWRSELDFARLHGFNLMKFCLWVPPSRYLELADEMGVLTWIEYPTWHPSLTEKFLAPLRAEFREFFQNDRNHPSVILRSLTCETGPSAELNVIRSLYDSAHQLIPGALVEDDSSWIGWNRVHDFYDDHPYGNNHTWVKTLDGFNDYIRAHGLKPLVLGEAIAADSWVDREGVLARLGTERPWWASGALDDVAAWSRRMQSIAGPGGLRELGPDSLRYGWLMRKYQIEAFRREIPYGGYVVSVIRDFPKASMGLIDYLDRPKWPADDWSWQRDTILLLKTENDRRSFSSGEPVRGQILFSHFGPGSIEHGELTVRLGRFGEKGTFLRNFEQKDVQQNPGTLSRLAEFDWAIPNVPAATHFFIRADLRSGDREFHNQWPVWVLPASPPNARKNVQVHDSLAPSLRQELFPGCKSFGGSSHRVGPASDSLIVVASRFDDALVRWLEAGGRVLLLPDGQSRSFPLNAHWFLRGAPYIPDHPLGRQIPRDLFVELQHFDLAADVVPDLARLEDFDPILLLWDTHDQATVSTHGVIFETRAAKGRLLVSAARHSGANNPAGRWLLSVLLDHLRSPAAPRHALPEDVWAYLKSKLRAEQTNLVSRTWKFNPDPKNEGLSRAWHTREFSGDADWKDIRIGAWWESQGYPDLDGWAWYRLWVDIPGSWHGRDIFLSFEGVDDIYELYVNGKLAGKGGDLATHKDALNEKKSHNITALARSGQKALIAVRVHDWYGAGGIFRPVTLGTLAFNPALDLLK